MGLLIWGSHCPLKGRHVPALISAGQGSRANFHCSLGLDFSEHSTQDKCCLTSCQVTL